MTTSIEQYLNTSYHPDREFVDGLIVERNLGEKTHSAIQKNLMGWFWDRRLPAFRRSLHLDHCSTPA
jgi:hypothetical protein